MGDPQGVLRGLVEAFATHDEGAMRGALADDLAAYVTNAEGGVDRVDGRDAFVQRLLALEAPVLNIVVTQAVRVAEDQALAMVEIRAERQGRSLHNFAAFLARVRNGQLVELWMVDALPAYSDEFWK